MICPCSEKCLHVDRRGAFVETNLLLQARNRPLTDRGCRRALRCELAKDSGSKQQSSTVVVPGTTKAFSEWAEASGVKMPGLTLALPDDGVRGVFTSTERHRSSNLMSVPARFALQVSSLDTKRSPCPEYISDKVWGSSSWYTRLAVKLLLAKRQGRNGLLSEYIQELPKQFDNHPFHWSEDELAMLQSSRMIRAVHDLRRSYMSQYSAIVAENREKPWITYEEFIWAVQCIRSRAFSGELEVAPFKERFRLFTFVAAIAAVSASTGVLTGSAALNGALTAISSLAMYDILTPRILSAVQGIRLKRYALVPGIDFVNHASRVNQKAEVSYEYFLDSFAVACGEDYKAGDEVAISYGAQSNDAFLQFYGFVEVDNPADDYVFDEDLEQTMSLTRGTLKARRSDGFDKTVVEQLARSFNGDEQTARRTLIELCQAELSNLPTTLSDDEKIQPRSYSEQLAIDYRMEKKKVLHDAIQALEKAGQISV